MSAAEKEAGEPLAERIAVVGAGTMGRGIAEVAAVSGDEVLLFDSDPAAVANAMEAIRASVARKIERGRLPGDLLDRLRLVAVAEMGMLAGASVVVEAIVENLEAKRKLFAELERVVPDSTILASNTSSISPTAIAARLEQPERVVGMHFFNPVPAMKLVEVVAGQATRSDAVDRIAELARHWGKQPVVSLARPGFIVNRVARPFYAEAWRLVEESLAEPRTVDTVLVRAGGFRMGPFELMDLIGHDVNQAVTRSVWELLGYDSRFAPSYLQSEYVLAGWLGRKAERGVRWPDRSEQPGLVVDVPAPASARIPEASVLLPLLKRAEEKGVRLESAGTGPLELPSGVVVETTRGRTAAERERALGRPVIVVDLSLDYTTASGIAFAVSPRAEAQAVDEFAALLDACGMSAYRLQDVPGLFVARTLAMLSNVAHDAVRNGLTSSHEIDSAMRLGTNYPIGPFEWTEQLGAGVLVEVLGALYDFYGDPRYRIAPDLRAAAEHTSIETRGHTDG